jgi:hypothetical protein
VKSLLHGGADVNATRPDGTTPIFFAAQDGRVEVARVLAKVYRLCSKNKLEHAEFQSLGTWTQTFLPARAVQAGADVNAARMDGATPFMMACQVPTIHVPHLLPGAPVRY